MRAANKTMNVMDITLVSETATIGYIDFGRSTNSFKAYIVNKN